LKIDPVVVLAFLHTLRPPVWWSRNVIAPGARKAGINETAPAGSSLLHDLDLKSGFYTCFTA
jgi:hypothetical protein